MSNTFQQDLTALLNRHSVENTSGTPDWILSEYLMACLRNFDAIAMTRAKWRGESTELPALQALGANARRRQAQATLIEVVRRGRDNHGFFYLDDNELKQIRDEVDGPAA